MDSIDNIKKYQEQQAAQFVEAARHKDLLDSENRTQEVILRSVQSLVEFLGRNISKTEVLNQLKSIDTPDVLQLIPHIESLHETLKTHENVDLSETTNILRQVLEEARQIPKTLPEEREEQDYTSQFKALTDAIQSVEKVVSKQKLVVEAPVVNVPETNVNVDAPDLTPLQSGLSEVVKAVKSIVIPEVPKFDTSKLEKEQKAQTKVLKELLDKPVGSVGGGGGNGSRYINSTGEIVDVELTPDGKIPVEAGATSVFESRFDTTSVPGSVFLAKAVAGSVESDAVWQIKKVNISAGSSTFADDVTTFTKAWGSRLSYSY